VIRQAETAVPFAAVRWVWPSADEANYGRRRLGVIEMAKINYTGTDGQDTFTGIGEDQYSIFGAGGKDTLTGGDAADVIKGGTGSDVLDGGLGNDLIKGGGGNDNVSGGDGNDLLFGNSGDDFLIGGGGNDLLRGGEGADNMNGGIGNDILFVKGDDTVTVGEGIDVIAVASIPNSIPDGLVTVLGFTNACASFNFGGESAVYNVGSNTWTLGGMTIQSGDGNSLAPPV
jgi:Ca2+-binding RTX toxin-like protein